MNRGFTLVEILVVLLIIGILLSLILSALFGTRKSARDSKRKSDLATIQSALEQYHADQGFYPTIGSVISGGSLTSSTGNPSPPTPSRTYLSKIPSDPLGGAIYRYFYAGTNLNFVVGQPNCTNSSGDQCGYYCLYAAMENSVNGNIGASGVCRAIRDVINPTQTLNYVVSPT